MLASTSTSEQLALLTSTLWTPQLAIVRRPGNLIKDRSNATPPMIQLLSLSRRTLTTLINPISRLVLPTLPRPTPPSTFSSLNLHPKLDHALASTGIVTPTPIQTSAIPQILSGNHTLLAAETGAGKTLAYLAPLLSVLKSQDQPSQLLNAPSNRPSLLVLLPTRELAAQVARVAKSLSHVAKLRVRLHTGAESTKRIRRLKDTPYDVLVTTPGGVAVLRNRHALYMSAVRSVVLDEADQLLADAAGFGDQLTGLLSTLRSKKAQHVYVAATVPGGLEQVLKGWHSDISIVRGEKLHRVAGIGRVRVNFIRVDGPDDAKIAKVVEIVTAATARDDGKTMVFCDGAERREYVVQALLRRGMEAVRMSGEGRSEERENNWERFRAGGVIAVCSSAFGRGIDDEKIGNVVLMDVPMTGGEYVHRVGRIRRKGRVYVLVGRREEARAEALFLGHVNGESLTSVRPRNAWKDYTSSGRDRISHDKGVRRARRKREARWVDERVSADGQFRGRRRRANRSV